MSPFIKNLRNSISGVKPRDLVYPGIIFLFIILVVILFFLVTQFIAKNINNAFSGDVSGESSSLNMTNYTLVTKKLGISTEVQKESAPPAPTPTEAPTTTAPEVEVLDKQTLTLNILNSSTKSGVATTLSKALEAAGFAKATTGNEKTKYATTTILIKESKASFGPALLEEVKKIYPGAVATTTADTASFDAVIIIGTK